MAQGPSKRRLPVLAAATVVAFLVAYFAFLAEWEPGCGAPGNTYVGRIDQYVPVVLLGSQALVIVAYGVVSRQPLQRIVLWVFLAVTVTFGAGALMEFLWFASSNCFA
jgi:hypothetical protein